MSLRVGGSSSGNVSGLSFKGYTTALCEVSDSSSVSLVHYPFSNAGLFTLLALNIFLASNQKPLAF
jgi:hypothetical protein